MTLGGSLVARLPARSAGGGILHEGRTRALLGRARGSVAALAAPLPPRRPAGRRFRVASCKKFRGRARRRASRKKRSVSARRRAAGRASARVEPPQALATSTRLLSKCSTRVGPAASMAADAMCSATRAVLEYRGAVRRAAADWSRIEGFEQILQGRTWGNCLASARSRSWRMMPSLRAVAGRVGAAR